MARWLPIESNPEVSKPTIHVKSFNQRLRAQPKTYTNSAKFRIEYVMTFYSFQVMNKVSVNKSGFPKQRAVVTCEITPTAFT